MSEGGTGGTGKARGGRWIKVALAVSVALNLGVLGLVAGAVLRDGPPRARLDFGMGPLSEALSRDDRRALRKAFVERHPDFRGDRQAMMADLEALVAALRAEPFEAAALDAALEAIARRNADLLDSGRDLVAERLKAMGPGEREAFADRLEKAIPRVARRDRDEKGEKGGGDGGY